MIGSAFLEPDVNSLLAWIALATLVIWAVMTLIDLINR